MNEKAITTIILAAGFSSRMKEFKPLSVFSGKTFLENVIVKPATISREIIVVTGYKNELIEKEIAKIRENVGVPLIANYNKNFHKGMFSSIKSGVREVKTDWTLLHFVDQPSLPKEFYAELYERISAKYDWVQPCFNGKNAHPIAIYKRAFDLILQAADTDTLKNVSLNIENKLIYKTEFPQTLDNFNEKSAYHFANN